MPVNMRTHGHGQGYADLNFLIPELVESMLIRKGPYWASEGDFASAGIAAPAPTPTGWRTNILSADRRQLRLLARAGCRLDRISAPAC